MGFSERLRGIQRQVDLQKATDAETERQRIEAEKRRAQEERKRNPKKAEEEFLTRILGMARTFHEKADVPRIIADVQRETGFQVTFLGGVKPVVTYIHQRSGERAFSSVTNAFLYGYSIWLQNDKYGKDMAYVGFSRMEWKDFKWKQKNDFGNRYSNAFDKFTIGRVFVDSAAPNGILSGAILDGHKILDLADTSGWHSDYVAHNLLQNAVNNVTPAVTQEIETKLLATLEAPRPDHPRVEVEDW